MESAKLSAGARCEFECEGSSCRLALRMWNRQLARELARETGRPLPSNKESLQDRLQRVRGRGMRGGYPSKSRHPRAHGRPATLDERAEDEILGYDQKVSASSLKNDVPVVIDTSALLAILLGSRSEGSFLQLLSESETRLLSTAND